MRQLIKVLVPVAAIGLIAAPGQAQLVNFVTQGAFTSASSTCSQTIPAGTITPLGAACVGDGFELDFVPEATTLPGVTPNIPNSTVNLGTFVLTGSGQASAPAGAVDFTLRVLQTTPSNGSGVFIGSITGAVASGPEGFSSTLVWQPNQSITIGDPSLLTTYMLAFVTDPQTGASGIFIHNNGPTTPTTIGAAVTVTPEPASMGLFATGLVGLAGFVKRRQKNKDVA